MNTQHNDAQPPPELGDVLQRFTATMQSLAQGLHLAVQTLGPMVAILGQQWAQLAEQIEALPPTRDEPRSRWTDDTAARLAEATGAHYLLMGQIDADGNSPCVCGRWAENATETGWDDHMAEVTLTALADAGLLVGPRERVAADARDTHPAQRYDGGIDHG